MKEIPIIYENNEILIVNKRAGLAVQGGEGVKNPLDSLLSEQLGAKVYPVHRLDKETSGLLVVAKTSVAARLWTGLIASGQVKKEYQALCFGLVQDLNPASALGKTGRLIQRVQVAGAGKTAETFYQVAEIFPVAEIASVGQFLPLGADFGKNPLFSLLNLTLGTGRTHQIRIHLAQAGCPILADDKHGNFKVNKLVKKAVGIKTLQLAATRLTIPLEGRATTFQISLPPHMAEALAVMSNGTLSR